MSKKRYDDRDQHAHVRGGTAVEGMEEKRQKKEKGHVPTKLIVVGEKAKKNVLGKLKRNWND